MTQDMNVYGKFTDMFKYVIKRTNVLRSLFLLFTLMTLGATNAWAQDLSGTYYIKSGVNDKEGEVAEDKALFYLCPANNNTQNLSNEFGKPFLTTHKAEEDMSNFVWRVVKKENENSYYIIHDKDGKYLTINGPVDKEEHRRRVHLENTDSPGEDQLFVFELNADGTTYNIRHKSLVVNGNKYLNPKGNNKDTYGDDNTPNNMIGLYSGTTGGSKWFLVPALRFPSIHYNTDNKVEITYPETTNIYYTTDGTTPNTSSTPYTGAFELKDGMTTVKAIAESNPTGVVVFTPPVHVGDTHIRLIQSQSNKWNDTDPYFYLIPGDVTSGVTKINTTSMFKPNMQWHFLSAGVEGGCQYYYVVNNNGQYLRYNSTSYIHLTDYDSGDDNSFKFRIPQNPLTGTPTDFNLVPHDIATTKTTNFLVNKNSGNNNANAINLTANATDLTSRWKFVTESALAKTAPFTVSTSSSITSYKIQCNNGEPEYFIALPATAAEGAKVRVSNSTEEAVVRTMSWYFELAQAAADDDWTDYYYIRSSATGDYLYYIGNTTTSNSQVFELRSEYNEANKERYLFTWVRTITPDNYFIVPKMVKEESQNDVSSLRRDNEQLKVMKARATGVSAWQFIETIFTADPVITQDIETGSISITCHTPGVDIYYTTDGSDPDVPEVGQEPTGATKKYTVPFLPVSSDVAINAVAVSASDHSAASTSGTTTKPLPKYTYHIVDKSGNVAISSNPVLQPTGKSLNGYSSIPEEIRSPYIADETITFYNNADCAEEHIISVTPGTSDIYIKYTTTNLGNKFLHLQGARALNVTINGDYISDNGTAGSGTFAHKAGATEDEKTTRPYLWYLLGNDPYAIEIRNAQTNNYVGYTTPSTLSLETAPTNRKFILMTGSAPGVYTGDGEHYEQMELMAATGDGNYYRISRSGDAFSLSTTAAGDATLQVRAYPNSSSATYNLIDQAGKILLTKTGKLEDVAVPTEWVSPMVGTYNYWKVGAFDIYGTGENAVYKLKDNPEAYRITTPTDVDDGMIYITYEVNNTITFDISDDDAVHNELYSAYRLKFYGGEDFLQENGKDGLDASAQKAEYPYSNGDAMLYVYSEAKRETQFNSGASTRPRWLWYAVSPQAAKVNTGSGEVDVTPGYKGDPYHVKIMSHSAQASSHNYFRTYVVNYGGSNHVVTGVTTKNSSVSTLDPEHPENYQLPTEYMILSAPNGRFKLVTLNKIPLDINNDGDYDDEGEGTEHRTVNTFEQYWKNNPTVQNKLGDAKVTESESTTDDGIELTTAQASVLTGWHTYKAWANAAPWVSWSDASGSGKQYHNKHHWFQTIDMGSTGEFTFEATTLEPEVILLDNHGWEIMRMPLSDAAKLKKYDSPMVETYHWYPTAAKVTGYHKYKVSDPEITVYYSYEEGGKTKWGDSGDRYTHTSKSLADNPYLHFTEHGWKEQPASVKTDFYVTYDVSSAYAHYYSGAATEEDATATAFWVKQGDDYAYINGSNQLTTTPDPTTLPDTEVAEWYVKPNFNIDVEMGYQYDVEEDDGAGGTYTPNKTQKDAKNYEEGRNGFDPYNVQFQNFKNKYYYFKTNTTGSHLAGGWEGTSTNLSLQNMSAGRQENVDGYDQTKLSITNATFMVVKDESGHMLLMPRFDHTKVVNSFTDPYLSAPNAATQTLELTMAPMVIHSSREFTSLNGQYTLASDFEFEADFKSLGASDDPFTGSIDGGLHPISGLSVPIIAYANGAIIKNVILDEVDITTDGNAGAIVANATGETRIYNCGINGGSVGGTGNVGGIVGNLHGEEITVDGKKKYIGARVINCYSYATITSGTNVGGIVGNNDFASTASNIVTMVMNCMFYGDITGGTNKSPVYGGTIINNQLGGLNNFNYYAYEKLPTDHITSGKYNNALAVEDKFLNRFEYYRLLLNSNKKLAAFYASSEEETVKPSDMMKWVLETADRTISSEDAKPYPVLKAQGYYPSIIN